MSHSSRKFSTVFFLFILFVLTSAVVGYWLYQIYQEQTRFSKEQTLSSIECGRLSFDVIYDEINYENGTLTVYLENTGGHPIEQFTFESALDIVTLNVTDFKSGAVTPVSVQLRITDWIQVYPSICQGINFKNISFAPNIDQTDYKDEYGVV